MISTNPQALPVTTRSAPSHGAPLAPLAPGPAWSPTPPLHTPAAPADDRTFTVAIIDDQPVTRTGMERVVSQDPRLTVVASVPDVNDLPADETACDIAVLALPARTGSSLDMIAKAATIGRPLITSNWDHPPTLLAAMRAGARGCLTRYSDQNAVIDALHVVARGGVYLCTLLVDQFNTELNQPHQDDPTILAPREIETLRWIALGFTQAQIANRMGLSQATVNTYAKRIRGKLNVGNKADLTRVAIELGYLSNDRRHPAA